MTDTPTFLMVTCQVGAEGALKHDLPRRLRAQQLDARLSFSRPGFVTFKMAPLDSAEVESAAVLRDSWPSPLARSYSLSLGKATGAALADLQRQFWEIAAAAHMTFDALHVWQRDTATPGFHHFEPEPTQLAADIRGPLLAAAPGGVLSDAAVSDAAVVNAAGDEQDATRKPDKVALAPRGARVLDCILVESEQWHVGWHIASDLPSRLPGGMRPTYLPSHAVSRAYLKMEEAIFWSQMPIRAGDVCVELGCAPGGAAQALLDRGATVIGVDPAEVDPKVAAHAHFRHIRRRGKEVPRSELAGVRYLVADMNVAPTYTLDTVGDLVTHPKVRIDGMLLTLKLTDWSLAEEIDAYLERVRSWGFEIALARQLQHNRQELCLAAFRSDRARSSPRGKSESRTRSAAKRKRATDLRQPPASP
jgi:23S rRNA (cytidine2498-2'-O)-methyltransferase